MEKSAHCFQNQEKRKMTMLFGKIQKKSRAGEQILHQRMRTFGNQMLAFSMRLDTLEKVLMETIMARFEEINAFVFEVVASKSRRADRAG